MNHFFLFINAFKNLPFKWHISLSLGLLVSSLYFGYLMYEYQNHSLENSKNKLETALNVLQSKNETAKLNSLNHIDSTSSKKTFIELLSSNSKSDEVVREMSRLAAGKGIGLESLKIAPTAATASELGKVQYNVTMKTDYYLFKGWLGSLLSRYPALGVNTLSIRGIAADSNRQDINLSLLLYVKD